MKEEKISINVVIADRTYPLKIEAAEEEQVRRAAKLINDKVKEFKKKYDAKDKQDYLAMCALMYAVESLKHESDIVLDKPTTEKLDELDSVLADFLKR